MRRRRFLTGTAATAALLAGCGSDDDGTTTDPDDTGGGDTTTDPPANGTETPENPITETPAGTPTQSPTDTPTETPTESPTEMPTDTPTPAPDLRNGSFEDGLAHWTVDRQLPDDPNNPGQKVEASAEPTSKRASDGDGALQIAIDGSQDDGTVWVQQEADLSGVSTLAVDGYSEHNSFNTVLQVAAYAGPVPEDGLSEVDFDRSNSLWDHEGWKTYEYSVDHDGPGLVAVGLNIVWETGAVGILDNVRLE